MNASAGACGRATPLGCACTGCSLCALHFSLRRCSTPPQPHPAPRIRPTTHVQPALSWTGCSGLASRLHCALVAAVCASRAHRRAVPSVFKGAPTSSPAGTLPPCVRPCACPPDVACDTPATGTALAYGCAAAAFSAAFSVKLSCSTASAMHTRTALLVSAPAPTLPQKPVMAAIQAQDCGVWCCGADRGALCRAAPPLRDLSIV